MLSEMHGLYKKPWDLASDRGVCSSDIHDASVTETNLAFARTGTAAGMDPDLEHLLCRLAELYYSSSSTLQE